MSTNALKSAPVTSFSSRAVKLEKLQMPDGSCLAHTLHFVTLDFWDWEKDTLATRYIVYEADHV